MGLLERDDAHKKNKKLWLLTKITDVMLRVRMDMGYRYNGSIEVIEAVLVATSPAATT